MSRVGALRPLKFARHLPAQGWEPVVLADLRAHDAMDARLLASVPDATPVIWDYGRRARDNKAAFDAGELPRPAPPPRAPTEAEPGLLSRVARLFDNRERSPTFWLPSEDLMPLGIHAFDVRHAVAAGRAALEAHRCEAIMVNADPFAALVVGARLARETGLPLIHDLRDPWALCELRRHERPWPQRKLVDRLERDVIEAASAVVLNTERARRDYVAHYDDLEDSRFECIRNHGDRALIADGALEPFERFTALFLGNFRRYVEGEVLLEALAELRGRGVDGDKMRLVVAGACPPATWQVARRLGVAEMLEQHPSVPYTQVGALMAAADVLVSLSHDTAQRIPAKIYDYASSARPLVVVCDNPELAGLMRGAGGARVCGRRDARAIADALQAMYDGGRRQTIDRSSSGLDSATAAAKLASILDRVTR